LPPTFAVRRATIADAPIIARHRAEMFSDMGSLPRALYEDLVAATISYLQKALPSEEYVGWLAAPEGQPELIVAGAGLLQRRIPPRPVVRSGATVRAEGREGLILNVFTEKAWRRQGLAELLMRHVLHWAADTGIENLVLHASNDGRPLYERLGFVATNEMRYAGWIT